MNDTAQITAGYGRRYIVRTPDGTTYEASTRKNASISPAATASASAPSTPNKL